MKRVYHAQFVIPPRFEFPCDFALCAFPRPPLTVRRSHIDSFPAILPGAVAERAGCFGGCALHSLDSYWCFWHMFGCNNCIDVSDQTFPMDSAEHGCSRKGKYPSEGGKSSSDGVRHFKWHVGQDESFQIRGIQYECGKWMVHSGFLLLLREPDGCSCARIG